MPAPRYRLPRMLVFLLSGCQIYKEVLTEAIYDNTHHTWDGVSCERLERYPDQLRRGMPTTELSGLIRCEYTVRELSTTQDLWKWKTSDVALKVTAVNGRVSTWELVDR